VIDSHEIVGSFVGVFGGILTGKPTIITVYEPKPLKRPLVKLSFRLLMVLADAVVTDSEARRNEIGSLIIWPRPNVFVIPNGIVPPTSQHRQEDMRTLLGLAKDPQITIVGQISRLVEHKGHLTLLKAARMVLQQNNNVVFLIVGFDPQRGLYTQQLRQWAADFGINDSVKILSYPGYIGDVWKTIDTRTRFLVRFFTEYHYRGNVPRKTSSGDGCRRYSKAGTARNNWPGCFS
jgi:glycosyltransferase involved in cell wall biosynthesis